MNNIINKIDKFLLKQQYEHVPSYLGTVSNIPEERAKMKAKAPKGMGVRFRGRGSRKGLKETYPRESQIPPKERLQADYPLSQKPPKVAAYTYPKFRPKK